jgi:hypothetical protein
VQREKCRRGQLQKTVSKAFPFDDSVAPQTINEAFQPDPSIRRILSDYIFVTIPNGRRGALSTLRRFNAFTPPGAINENQLMLFT